MESADVSRKKWSDHVGVGEKREEGAIFPIGSWAMVDVGNCIYVYER